MEVRLITTEKQSIKGYELLEPIGEGAYGVVYCTNKSFVGRQVGIKVFPIQWIEE
jgi:hypothetical protein